MAIELNKIPETITPPQPPDKMRWFFIVIIIVFVGVIGSLLLWPDNLSTHSAWFWFCTLAIPLLAGGLGYVIRLRVYENARVRILWWNHLHEDRHDELVLQGQRAAAVLGVAYITPNACNKLASILLQDKCMLEPVFSSHLQETITSARLSLPLNSLTAEGYRERLNYLLTTVIQMIEPELSACCGPLSVRLRHDGILENTQIISVWQQVFPQDYVINEINAFTDNDGLMWLDNWLDKKDSALILSVELNLFIDPRHRQAESVSAVLLASPEWQEKNSAIALALVHRPVIDKAAHTAVNDTARWGKLSPGEAFMLWRTQLNDGVLRGALQEMDRRGYLSAQQGDYILDDVFGNPGVAVGNIGLICASEHARETRTAQWLIMQEMTAHQVIVQPVS